MISRLDAQAIGADLRVGGIDADADGVLDLAGNCPYQPNSDQSDVGRLGATLPDGIGDACQCGELTNDGSIFVDDVERLRTHLSAAAPLTAAQSDRCAVNGSDGACDIRAFAVLTRALAGDPPAPQQVCPVALF